MLMYVPIVYVFLPEINVFVVVNHLQNLNTHVHYNTIHAHICTGTFITYFSPNICGICLHSLKMFFVSIGVSRFYLTFLEHPLMFCHDLIYTVLKLQMIKNTVARVSCRINKYMPISRTTPPKSLHWLPVKFWMKYKIQLYVY